MPNHVNAVISFIETEQNINSIIGNGKRFMAYDIVKRLKENNEGELLNLLANAVEIKCKTNNKNMKYGNCLLIGSIVAVINLYNRKWITFLPVRSGGRSNPCKEKWNLSALPEQYKHSSAKYYLSGAQGFYKVDNVGEMSDKVFVQSVDTIMIYTTSGKGREVAEKEVFSD